MWLFCFMFYWISSKFEVKKFYIGLMWNKKCDKFYVINKLNI